MPCLSFCPLSVVTYHPVHSSLVSVILWAEGLRQNILRPLPMTLVYTHAHAIDLSVAVLSLQSEDFISCMRFMHVSRARRHTIGLSVAVLSLAERRRKSSRPRTSC